MIRSGSPDMVTNRVTLLCMYQYDPLDRLVGCARVTLPKTRIFYLKECLATEIEGATQLSTMQYSDQLLAQKRCEGGTTETLLLATDRQRSVLSRAHPSALIPCAYTAYGHHIAENSLLGFNGERPDPVTGNYLLGRGYRAFNPALMRFTSPDSWSPFGEGGLNGYAYCDGEPVNRRDPTGHSWKLMKAYMKQGKFVRPASARARQLESNTTLKFRSPASLHPDLTGIPKPEAGLSSTDAMKRIQLELIFPGVPMDKAAIAHNIRSREHRIRRLEKIFKQKNSGIIEKQIFTEKVAMQEHAKQYRGEKFDINLAGAFHTMPYAHFSKFRLHSLEQHRLQPNLEHHVIRQA